MGIAILSRATALPGQACGCHLAGTGAVRDGLAWYSDDRQPDKCPRDDFSRSPHDQQSFARSPLLKVETPLHPLLSVHVPKIRMGIAAKASIWQGGPAKSPITTRQNQGQSGLARTVPRPLLCVTEGLDARWDQSFARLAIFSRIHIRCARQT